MSLPQALKGQLAQSRIVRLEESINKYADELEQCHQKIKRLTNELEVYRTNFIDRYVQKESVIRDIHQTIDKIALDPNDAPDPDKQEEHDDNTCVYFKEAQDLQFQVNLYKNTFEGLKQALATRNNNQDTKSPEIAERKGSFLGKLGCLPFY